MAFTVTNNLDDAAIYLGLARLPGETDELFSSRIKRFASIRYGIDYEKSTLSVLEQIGLKATAIAKISCIHPFTFSISQDYVSIETYPVSGSNEVVNIFINHSGALGQRIQDRVAANSSLTLDIIDSSLFQTVNRETLFKGSNFKLVQTAVSNKRQILDGAVIPGSISSSSQYTARKRDSLQDLVRAGDFYIDYETSLLEFFSAPSNPFTLTYKAYSDAVMYFTEFNLLSLDSYYKYGLNDNFITLLSKYLTGKSLGY